VLSCHLFSGLVSSPFLHFEDPFPFEEERRERQADTKDLTSSSKVLRVLGPNLTDAIIQKESPVREKSDTDEAERQHHYP